MNEGYEIDFLPVGSGERSGDAICVRCGSPGDYKVMVYDGGTKESGFGREGGAEGIEEYLDTKYIALTS